MRPTHPRDLAIAAGVGLAVAYLLCRAFYFDIGTALPRSAPLSVLVVGIAELQLALGTRARLAGRAKPIAPLTVARLAALARASGVAAAVIAGAWAGVLAYTLPRRDAPPVVGADAITAALGLAAAVVLLVGATLLERVCRVRR